MFSHDKFTTNIIPDEQKYYYRNILGLFPALLSSTASEGGDISSAAHILEISCSIAQDQEAKDKNLHTFCVDLRQRPGKKITLDLKEEENTGHTIGLSTYTDKAGKIFLIYTNTGAGIDAKSSGTYIYPIKKEKTPELKSLIECAQQSLDSPDAVTHDVFIEHLSKAVDLDREKLFFLGEARKASLSGEAKDHYISIFLPQKIQKFGNCTTSNPKKNILGQLFCKAADRDASGITPLSIAEGLEHLDTTILHYKRITDSLRRQAKQGLFENKQLPLPEKIDLSFATLVRLKIKSMTKKDGSIYHETLTQFIASIPKSEDAKFDNAYLKKLKIKLESYNNLSPQDPIMHVVKKLALSISDDIHKAGVFAAFKNEDAPKDQEIEYSEKFNNKWKL